MVVRPSRVLERNVFGGARGAGIGAPTRGLGRFFQRSRILYGTEPMYAPHRIHADTPNDRWNESIFQNYNSALSIFLIFFILAPFLNSIMFYAERTYTPDRVPLPGCFNNFTDLDDPDWRLKRQMHQIEAAQGPRPTGYNRYDLRLVSCVVFVWCTASTHAHTAVMHNMVFDTNARTLPPHRYLDMMSTMKVSDPAFKPTVPKDHGMHSLCREGEQSRGRYICTHTHSHAHAGESIGPNAVEIIDRQNRRHSA